MWIIERLEIVVLRNMKSSQPRPGYGLRLGERVLSGSLFPVLLLLPALLSVLGCGGSGQDGRMPLNGSVTYDGQPVPYGDIVFTPDGSKGNSGPQGFASIVDGKYDTRKGALGKGVAGGPMQLRVSAFKEPGGKGIIVETEFELELPQEGGEFDIVIPTQKKAATNEEPFIDF